MTGEKYQPLIIGKSAKPRCFNKIKPESLPVMYRNNKKAWMNSYLFEEWLKKLNRKMKSQNRNILLFIDNAPSHPHLTLSNVKLAFFPPNTTSKTQPMDQGIIQTLKLKFRKKQLKFVLNQINKSEKSGSEILKEISILNAIYWVDSAWQEVEGLTIQKCFSRCGFDLNSSGPSDVHDDYEFGPEDDIPLKVVKLSQELFGCDFKDLTEIDEKLQGRDDSDIDFDMPADKLLETLNAQNCDDHDDDDDVDSEDSAIKIPVSKASDFAQGLRQFALQTGNQAILENVFKIEESLSDMLINNSKQSSICDFFKRQDN